ncbi:luciferin 4-monooxygenase-like [Choristoneura fumiferana]|uniref:luciferin 4-monooxygenase-like n=1 Tax=Choristoneura fumiferana TaxID=7141 RepID=UPI003D158B2E
MHSRADLYYKEDMTLSKGDILPKTCDYHLGHFFKDCMLENPDVIMQIDAATGEEETRRSVLTRSINLARCMRRLGLKPGDVLVLGGNNHLDLCIPYYAAVLNGYPIAGVDPFFKFEEIKELFKLVTPKVGFCQRESLCDYQRAVEELGLNTRLVTFDGDGNTMAELMDSCDKFETFEDFEIAQFDTDKVYAWLVSTSGSTGLPKVAAVKHQSVLEVIRFVATLRRKTKEEDASSTLPAPALALNLSAVQWVSAFVNAFSMPTMNQINVQTSAPASIEHVIDIINKYRPKATSLIAPSIMHRILKHEKPCDLSCFNTVYLGGSSVYQSFLLDLKAALRPDALVIETYGQTECLGMVLFPAPQGPPGNCGREMPLVKVKLVDPVTGETIMQPNVPGELWTKGPGFTEYYKNPEETAKAFSDDGWHKTGDMLRRDENGFYYFVERLKMLIKFGEYSVVPLEVEEAILKHEGVLNVCVTSIPKEVDGEWPVAVVVRAAGAVVTAQEIKDLVANTLSVHKQLRGGVLFVEELPMTSTGKIARGKVRELVQNAVLE